MELAPLYAAVSALFVALCAVVGYVRGLHAEQLTECRSGRDECEDRNEALQRQVDALIDGDNDLAKRERETDRYPVRRDPPTPSKGKRGIRKFWAVLIVGLSLLLVGCSAGDVLRRAVPTPDPIKDAVAAKVEAEHKADEAIKTSADARAASLRAAAEVRSIQRLLAEKQDEVVRLDQEAIALERQEVAHRITVISWWLSGVGLVVGAVGAFLFVRLQSRTAGVAALSGAGCIALGLFGLWLAPHWLLFAWGAGIAVILGGIGLLLWLVVHHDTSATHLAAELKIAADLLPAEARRAFDEASLKRQPARIAKNVTRWLKRTPSTGAIREPGNSG